MTETIMKPMRMTMNMMEAMTKTTRQVLPVASTLLILAACSEASPTEFTSPNLHVSSASGVRLITQNVVPAASMDALFQGRLFVDDRGCIRLGSEDDATVVWPHGFTADRTVEGVSVRDADGALFGRVGEELSFAGGEVATLHEGMGFTEDDRSLATQHCPGRYWIVG